MKNKFQALTLCALFGLGSAFAAPIAQDQAAPPQATTEQQHRHRHFQADPNKQLEFMTKKLNLTADQQNQLLPILTDRQQQIQTIRADNSLSKQDRRDKIRSVMQDSRTKIQAVLTDTQKQTWQQMRDQHRQRHQEQKQEGQNS